MVVISTVRDVLLGVTQLHRYHQYALSVLFLANLVPILGVIVWEWGLFTVVFLIWADSVVIFLYTLLKLLLFGSFSSADSLVMGIIELLGTAFLLAKIVGYVVFYFFVLTLVFAIFYDLPGSGEFLARFVAVFRPAGEYTFLFGVIAFAIGHGGSFLSTVWDRERGDVSVGQLIAEPYLRTIYMTVITISIAIAIALLRYVGLLDVSRFEVLLIVVLVVLKIVADTVSYITVQTG